jgi:AI-2 transport system permease protein
MSVTLEEVAGARQLVAGRRGDNDRRWVLALVGLLVAEVIGFSLAVPGFFGHGTGLLSLTEQFLDIGTIALGASFVILAGEIDLSAGAMASFSGIVMAELWQHGVEIWLATAIAVAVCGLVGAVNGLLVTGLRISSLLVTLAMQFILSSVATAWGGNAPPYNFPKSFVTITGTGSVGPVPAQLFIFAVLALGTAVVVTRTSFGRGLVLTGYNREAARYAGVRVRWALVRAFILSGLLAGVAGILIAGFYNAARDDIGDSLLLPGITVVVLGGIDIFGGRGRISGVIVATFILGFLTQGLLVDGDSSLTASMVTGILLIACLVLKILIDRRSGITLGASVRRRFRRGGSFSPPSPAAPGSIGAAPRGAADLT